MSMIITVIVLIVGFFFLKNEFASQEPTEYQINKGIEKINSFIDKCSEPYKVTIANSNYQLSCDVGYITVEPYVLEAFNKQ
ncbi:hypothetical protein AB7W86_20755 [Providencia rettgeri]